MLNQLSLHDIVATGTEQRVLAEAEAEPLREVLADTTQADYLGGLSTICKHENATSCLTVLLGFLQLVNGVLQS
jgi:hypothetical protein